VIGGLDLAVLDVDRLDGVVDDVVRADRVGRVGTSGAEREDEGDE
jgi:hypothetical protein